MLLIFPKPKAFSTSSALMSASHAISHGCFVVRSSFQHRFHGGFVSRRPSACQKYSEKIRNPPLAFTHAWAILPSFPGIDSIAPSSAPTTAPRLLSIATKTLPGVCLRSSSPALSSVILAALAANLHPSLAFC